MTASNQEIRAAVVRACQMAYQSGAAGLGLAGHVSHRAGPNRMVLKPRPVNWLTLTPDELVEYDFEGNRVDGPMTSMTSCDEWTIHSQIYEAHPNINAVIHAHPPDSTLMVSLGIEFEPLTRETSAFYKELAVDSRPEVQHKIVDKDNANKMVAIMGKRRACVLKYHGTVICGETLEEMNYAAAELEIGARTMIQAVAAKKQPILTPADIKDRESVMVDAATRRFRAAERMGIMRKYYAERK